ncbi:MAG: hypothetical protein LBN10_05385 [Propionibacteriaceae bacterium]|jgi:multidrug/hemolysin transport system permease protein|nr:hypothetical protein [Propionibacteriaceae bacterium]
MTTLLTLIRRNIKGFVVDRAGVFFSLLGALIALFLVLLFLRTTIRDSIVTGFSGAIDTATADNLLVSWLIASACVIASATTGLGALAGYVDDRESTKWRDFLVAPIPRWMITAGYLGAATIISMVMTTLVYILGTAYCLSNAIPLSGVDVVRAWGWLMLSCVGFTALMGAVVSLVKTSSAFSGLSVIVGVAFGFVAETYVTASSLPVAVANVLNALPFAQASALVRLPYTSQVIASLPEVTRAPAMEAMGIILTVGDWAVTSGATASMLAAMIVVFFIAAWQIMTRTVTR